jgi:hypothetical protein
LEVEKHHFILIIGPHVNKYMFQHVSGPIFTKTALKFQGLKTHCKTSIDNALQKHCNIIAQALLSHCKIIVRKKATVAKTLQKPLQTLRSVVVKGPGRTSF